MAAGLWQIVGTLVGAILNWLLLVIISRGDVGLGASGIGIFNTALAIVGVFSILTAGMGKSTAQKVSENITDKIVAFEHARNGTFAAILMGIILGSILIAFSFFIGAPLSFRDDMSISTILFIIGLMMFLTGLRDGLTSNLAAVGEYDEIAISFMIIPFVQLLSGFVFIFLIKDFSLPISSILIVYIIGLIAQALYLRKHFRQLWFNAQIFRFTKVNQGFLKIMRQGFYFAITEIIPGGLLGSVIIIVLLIFTQNTYGYQIVGAYSVISGYSLGGLIVTGFAWPLITYVAEAYGKKDTARIKYYVDLIVKIFFYLTFLVITIDIGLSQGILSVFHGSQYLTGDTNVWIPFILVICGYAVGGFEYVLCSILLGVGKGRTAAIYLGALFLVTIGVTCFCIGLNLFPQPQLNASFGFLISTLIMFPFLPFLIKKHIQQPMPFRIGLRSLSALLSTLLISVLLVWPPLYLIPLSNAGMIFLMVILLVIIYILLLIFFGAISQEDFRLLERKAEEYGLKQSLDPLLSFLRKIMRISPFCESEECPPPE